MRFTWRWLFVATDRQVLNEIAQHKIKIYEFPDVDDEELRKSQRALRERVPFAVVGSNTVVEVDGRKIRGRRYPWGVVEGKRVGSFLQMKFFTNSKIQFLLMKFHLFCFCFLLVENMEHCDFIALRNMLIRTHMTDLKEVTNNVHYENFRCRKLAGVGVAANDGTTGKSNRISNKLVLLIFVLFLFCFYWKFTTTKESMPLVL